MGKSKNEEVGPQAEPQVHTATGSERDGNRISDKPMGKAYTEMPCFAEGGRSRRPSLFTSLLLGGVLVGSGFLGYRTWERLQNHRGPAGVVSHQSARSLTFTALDYDPMATEWALGRINLGDTPSLISVNSKNAALKPQAKNAYGAIKMMENKPIPADPGILKQIKSGEMQFYSFVIFDSEFEDGDVVELSLDGVSLGYVSMLNAGTTVSIPLNPNTSKTLSVRGAFDGGGGITFGIRLQTSGVMIKNMAVDEVLTFDLRYAK